ncbi:MAG TPA: dTDP-4-amino-4,6-dideoxygalactose transaminase [Vicinamibacterales bacterium]|nr:dTDP-4-amino-4,6-dideoxygalactose transaminase [Vicinamibacterales bacterium]
MSTPIWFNRPAVTGNELHYMQQAIESGHLSGDGEFTKRCHARLAEIAGAQKALLTTSCTHALEMAMLLVDLKPGDEVIGPAFTFVSTANAVALRGARPVFVDIRSDTLNLDERLLEAAITPRTRAVIVVHYAGVACEMDEILRIAAGHGIPVIEDNAHGLFGHYKGRPLGSFGAMSALSFHETKNLTCGEGGALLLNDAALLDRAEIIREKGTNRSRFFRGEVDRYTWVDIGSSYLPSELLGAYLWAQLESAEAIQRRRHEIWRTYARELESWAGAAGVRLPVVPDHCAHPAHIFYLLMPSLERRTALMRHLRERQILAPFHYLPLHLSDVGRRYGGRDGQCPVTEDVADRLVRLPLFYQLSAADQARVIEAIQEVAA